MNKSIWRDCKKQPPLVDDGELVLMDSNDKFWVGFCRITSDGVSYFANNAEPLKNDFVKYARIDKLLALEKELDYTRKALDQSETCCSEWEKQALDYKAEIIKTKQVRDIAVDKLKGIKAYYDVNYVDPHFLNWHIVAQRLANDADDAIKTITALEQKGVQ